MAKPSQSIAPGWIFAALWIKIPAKKVSSGEQVRPMMAVRTVVFSLVLCGFADAAGAAPSFGQTTVTDRGTPAEGEAAAPEAPEGAEVAPVAKPVVRAPQAFPSFEAKRIRPPQPGTSKRITVQIDPSQVPPPPAVVAQEDGSLAVVAPETRYGWFWEAVGSDLDNASPGRLADGLAVLEARPDIPQPRLQDLQSVIQAYGIPLLTQTAGTEVSPALALAVLMVESGGKADAISRVGAEGLMQLMPGTAEQFGVSDSFDPVQNITGGVRFLDALMREFSGDPMLVLAGYNAGAGAVKEHRGVPPFAETLDYVPKVLAAYQVVRNLCVTPPILMSDGCVFQTMK